uniref:GAF domain-containing protein n=1 Tax=Thermosporothrix sp. COM3 TaxID=2490863 RepID=A0A455SSF0_9CHLR|nr:hypothetical protein KTC_61040 [Thermosporothrix sp. COM3]
MEEVQNWRDILRKIVEDSKEKQRLIQALSISNITMSRWINGESTPRPPKLRSLVGLLSQDYREMMIAALREEKGLGEFVNPLDDETPQDIPPEFYAQVLLTRATTPRPLRYWSTCDLILRQALSQLDPHRQGLALWLIRCMPPSGPHKKVRSLRECLGMGTHPWKENLEPDGMFLGAESLAGHVVTMFHPQIVADLQEENTITPQVVTENERSCAIYPILYAGKIAGVLSALSQQVDYFSAYNRSSLLQKYADLMALALEPSDFYSDEEIMLHTMPPQEKQKKSFSRFSQIFRDVQQTVHDNVQSDLFVWQHLEEELLTPKQDAPEAH